MTVDKPEATAQTPTNVYDISPASVFESTPRAGNASSTAQQSYSFSSTLETSSTLTPSFTSDPAQSSSAISLPENASVPPATRRTTSELPLTTEATMPPASNSMAGQSNGVGDPNSVSTPTAFGITTEGNFPLLPAPYPTSSMIPVFTPDTLGNAYGGGYWGVPESYALSEAIPSGSALSGVPLGYAMPTTPTPSSSATSYASSPVTSATTNVPTTGYSTSSPGVGPTEGNTGYDRDMPLTLSPTLVPAATPADGDPPTLSTGVAVQNSSFPTATSYTATTTSNGGSPVESVTRKATESPPVFYGGATAREVALASVIGVTVALGLLLSI